MRGFVLEPCQVPPFDEMRTGSKARRLAGIKQFLDHVGCREYHLGPRKSKKNDILEVERYGVLIESHVCLILIYRRWHKVVLDILLMAVVDKDKNVHFYEVIKLAAAAGLTHQHLTQAQKRSGMLGDPPSGNKDVLQDC